MGRERKLVSIRHIFQLRDLHVCLLLAILSLLLFRDIIIGGHPLFGTDFVSFYLGMKQFLFQEIRIHHSIPFWNPHVFGGMPYWAHFESTIFYPLDFLFLLMPPERAYGYTIFLHVLLTSISMYFLGRSSRFSALGSLIAAIGYSFNCLMMATIYDGQMFRTQSYLWLPLIIWCLNKSITSGSFTLHGAFAGLFWGFQILAGAPQDAFYTFFGAMLFLSFHLRWRSKEARWNLRLFWVASLFFFFGSGIAAIQIIPAFEFIGHSVRSALDTYDLVTRGSYPPQGLITMALPHFFGNYTQGDFWVSDVPWSVPLYNLYVGALPVILLSFASRANKDSRKIFAYALFLAIFGLCLAMGSHTPFYQWLYHLPGFDRVRAPAKIIMLWVFACALMAGKITTDIFCLNKAFVLRRLKWLFFFLILIAMLGLLIFWWNSLVLRVFSPFILDTAIPSKTQDAQLIVASEFHRFSLLCAAIIIPIFFWARNAISQTATAVILCGIFLLDLGTVNQGAVRHNDPVYHWAAQTKKELDASIGQDKSLYRVGSFRFGMGANVEMYLGYQSIGGYNPLFLHRYYEYINQYRFYRNRIPEGWIVFFYDVYENGVLMDLLNVKYEISYATKSYGLRESFLPRAFIVPGCKTMNKNDILDHMVGTDFDPALTVLIEKESNEPDCHETSPPADMRSQARIVSYRPDELRLETDSNYPGHLFLSEVFYPGWKAFLDERPTRILRGNYLFRVVELPAGQHKVTLVFDPMSIKVGVVITLSSLFAFLVVVLLYFLRGTRLRPRHLQSTCQ